MQLAVHSIDRHVEQNQLDLQECLKYHHPSSNDDEDAADGIFGYILLCFPGPSETVRGSNFYDS
jgi:hypothetical protein